MNFINSINPNPSFTRQHLNYNLQPQLLVYTAQNADDLATNTDEDKDKKKAENFRKLDILKIAFGVDLFGHILMAFIPNWVEPKRSFASWCSSTATSAGAILAYWPLTLVSRNWFKPVSEKIAQGMFPNLSMEYLQEKIIPQIQAFFGLLTGLITNLLIISPVKGKLEILLQKMPIMRKLAKMTGLKQWEKGSDLSPNARAEKNLAREKFMAHTN